MLYHRFEESWIEAEFIGGLGNKIFEFGEDSRTGACSGFCIGGFIGQGPIIGSRIIRFYDFRLPTRFFIALSCLLLGSGGTAILGSALVFDFGCTTTAWLLRWISAFCFPQEGRIP